MTNPAAATRFDLEEKKLWWLPTLKVEEENEDEGDVEWYRGILPELRQAMLQMYP